MRRPVLVRDESGAHVDHIAQPQSECVSDPEVCFDLLNPAGSGRTCATRSETSRPTANATRSRCFHSSLAERVRCQPHHRRGMLADDGPSRAPGLDHAQSRHQADCPPRGLYVHAVLLSEIPLLR